MLDSVGFRLTDPSDDVPLDVSHQLESMNLNTRLSSQGCQSFIRQNDPSISRLLQFVPLDVLPQSLNYLGLGEDGQANNGFQHVIHKTVSRNVEIPIVWTL